MSTAKQSRPASPEQLARDDLAVPLALVARQRGIDFRDYHGQLLERRIRQRMAARQCPDARAYAGLLGRDPGEVDRLIDAFLVSVTQFFRDPPVFHALRQLVIPLLADGSRRPLRAWVVGAATGEEAYSLAMLLASAGPGAFEVLATDLDGRALDHARRGRYPVAAIEPVPPALRARFLRAADGGVQVADELCARVQFARHDVMGRRLGPKEAVIVSFDLILCRNVLIYFDTRLQEKAVQRFAGFLRPGGVLVLGQAETLPAGAADSFEAYPGVSPRLRIFRRKERSP